MTLTVRDQPLAIEAISILSRLNDFKGYDTKMDRLKIVEQQTPPFPDSPIPAELMKAEYQQFSNPMGISFLHDSFQIRCIR